MTKIMLCSDLDRTLLPNGKPPESPQARPLLRKIAQRPELTLAYVSGRHKALIIEAIRDYDLPWPDYAIGDVGTTIYEVDGDEWHPWQDWSEEIAPDWTGRRHDELAAIFQDIDPLILQEPEKQNVFKLSYYVSINVDHRKLLKEVETRLNNLGIRASLIWSIDDIKHIGLLDVLPQRSSKYEAIRFLMKHKDFKLTATVFAGDSGNDLDALTSGLQAVLVNNAHTDVREEALRLVHNKKTTESLYCARGNFLGMNGNYAAGVLEGLVHFVPIARSWLEDAMK